MLLLLLFPHVVKYVALTIRWLSESVSDIGYILCMNA